MDILLEILRQTGLAGLAAIAIVFALRKDKRCELLHDRLEAKSDRFVGKYYRLSSELNQTISALVAELDLEPVTVENGSDEDQEESES